MKRKSAVVLKAGNVLCADDRIVYAERDTVIFLPSYVDFYIRKKNADMFYNSLKDRAFRYRWSRELHNVILSSPSETPHQDTSMMTQKSEVAFLPYKGLVVKNIQFRKLDVFGPSVHDPDQQTNSIIGKAGNRLHYNTRNSVISNHLLFAAGDTIDPRVLADNERIFRELSFIEDARISVKNINEFGDSADIEIIIKDRWSFGVDLTTADLRNFYLNTWDDNVLGTGHEFQNQYYRRPDQLPSNGITGSYTIKNFNGSFINSRFAYNAFGNEDYSINFWRDFYTQNTKYAGAFYYQNIEKNYRSISDLNNHYYYDSISGNNFHFWIGRAFSLGHFSITSTSISNFAVSAGIFSNSYRDRPQVNKNYRYEFQNKTFYLVSFAFSAQGYYKTNLVFNYGRTEDIPYGLLLKFTHGIEVNEFSKRAYNAISFSKGNYLGNLGYFYGNSTFSGFLNKGKFEQGMFKLSTNMFTNLLVLNQYKFRAFASSSFVKGYARNDDEYLTLNNLSGIRGFFSDSVRGYQKLILNLEAVCFTPYYLAGFRFAVFAFADFAYTGPAYKSVVKNDLYNGFGLGLRFRNERLVFKTFQIRLAYYPWLPRHAQGDLFTISTEERFRTESFSVTAPEITPFR